MKITKNRVIEIVILVTLLILGVLGAYQIYHRTVVKPNLYTIRFHDIDSIIKGSPVRFMGIIVGHVRKLERKGDLILCQIFITKPNTKIPDGALAKVEFNGILGSISFVIFPPKTENPNIKGIVTTEALRINDFMDVVKNLREVLVCVKQFVDGMTPENTLGAAKAIAEAPDFTADMNKTLDEMTQKQQETSKKLKTLGKFQKEVENLIDRFTQQKTNL